MLKAVLESEERIMHFQVLGKLMGHLAQEKAWPGYACGLGKEEYEALEAVIQSQIHRNGWFTVKEIRRSLNAWSVELTSENLKAWTSKYPIDSQSPKKIGLIMAGNIPLVGFHDLLSTLLCGHIALVKTSSNDDQLIRSFIKVLIMQDERWNEMIHWQDGPMKGHVAVIATGSNNTSRYFEQYFANVPHIIRKNRTAVAILDGTETEEEMASLAEDIFAYFGLGCRNVTKLYLPMDFDLDRFFKAIFPYNRIAEHNKYANNYDYHKALYLLNEDDLLENGFLLLKEDRSLHSPVACMFFERYADEGTLRKELETVKEQIQCIVSKKDVPFGEAQKPGLTDYADGEDTMNFLCDL